MVRFQWTSKGAEWLCLGGVKETWIAFLEPSEGQKESLKESSQGLVRGKAAPQAITISMNSVPMYLFTSHTGKNQEGHERFVFENASRTYEYSKLLLIH